jgi:hypothetical protein
VSNLAATTGDARKRIEEALTVNVVVPAPEPCTCGHSRWLHYVSRLDQVQLSCICGCGGFSLR